MTGGHRNQRLDRPEYPSRSPVPGWRDARDVLGSAHATIPDHWQRALHAISNRRASLLKMGPFVKSGRAARDDPVFRTQRSAGRKKCARDLVARFNGGDKRCRQERLSPTTVESQAGARAGADERSNN
jgi:hypothetical protein